MSLIGVMTCFAGGMTCLIGMMTCLSECSFSTSGVSQAGFMCRSELLCIPFEHTCNGLDNCPDGSDEEEALCEGRSQACLV